MDYDPCIRCGWRTGVHDCRRLGYQHPWIAVHRPSGSAVGCYSRREAVAVLKALKLGVR